jgi:hypothetical protein
MLHAARDWLPQAVKFAALPADALAYAGRRVANLQGGQPVQFGDIGERGADYARQLLAPSGLGNPYNNETSVSAPYEPGVGGQITSFLNPALLAPVPVRSIGRAARGALESVLAPERHFLPIETATTGSGLESVGRPFSDTSALTHIQGDIAGDVFSGVPTTGPLLRGQGAWGEEANPLFVGELPAGVPPTVRDDLAALVAARANQEGVGPYSVRRPLSDADANSMLYPRPDRATIAELGRRYGDRAIVADNPHLGGLLMRGYGEPLAPDIDAETDLMAAAQMVVDEQIEKMLDAEDPEAPDAQQQPDEWSDLTYALYRGAQQVALGRLQGVPDANLDLLKDYVQNASDLLNKRMAANQNAGPGQPGAQQQQPAAPAQPAAAPLQGTLQGQAA